MARFAFLALVAALAGCAGFSERTPLAVDLSGEWMLNESLSDEVIVGERRGRRGQTSEIRDPFFDLLMQPQVLTIVQSPIELRLASERFSDRYRFNESAVIAAVQGVAAQRVAWRGDDLVVRYQVEDGPTAARTYSLAEDGRRLVVATRLHRGPGRDFGVR